MEQSERVIAIHGCEGEDEYLELGGLDRNFKKLIHDKLDGEFTIKSPKNHLRGEHEKNICNRGKNGVGV